jgi:hypothetical protein
MSFAGQISPCQTPAFCYNSRSQSRLAKSVLFDPKSLAVPQSKPLNPFYFLLAVVGVAFCVSASAFGLMTLRQSRAPQAVLLEEEQNQVHPLMKLMDQYGMTILISELGVLAVFSFAAMATDQMHTNKQARAESLAKSSTTDSPSPVVTDAEQGAGTT